MLGSGGVRTRGELNTLRKFFGLRRDWHEPDEQDVSVVVYGKDFDNSGMWGLEEFEYKLFEELHVVFYFQGVAFAAANLADLCAWASRDDLTDTA